MGSRLSGLFVTETVGLVGWNWWNTVGCGMRPVEGGREGGKEGGREERERGSNEGFRT